MHIIFYRSLCSTLEKFRNEREYLSNQLAGHSVDDEQSLKPHFQQYIIKIEETKTALDKRIEELRKVNEDQLEQLKVVLKHVLLYISNSKVKGLPVKACVSENFKKCICNIKSCLVCRVLY